jgi:hypothetical protein
MTYLWQCFCFWLEAKAEPYEGRYDWENQRKVRVPGWIWRLYRVRGWVADHWFLVGEEGGYFREMEWTWRPLAHRRRVRAEIEAHRARRA